MPKVIQVDMSGFDRRSQRIRAVFTSPRTAQELIRYLRDYHLRFRMKWRGDRYMAGPRSNLFWQSVVAGWQDPDIRGNQIILRNTFGLLQWKMTGGVILPKTATKLTIPLIPDAKGISVAQFVAEEETPLFRIGHALMRRIGQKLEAVYALVDAVIQDPWPGAVPSNEQLGDVYKQSVNRQIEEINRT